MSRVVRVLTGRWRARERRGPRRGRAGFSLIELLISLAVLMAGLSGVLSMQLTAFRATSYSRHATEAAVLGEDKMEVFRTMPVTDITDGEERVDERGQPREDGAFVRSWKIVWDDDIATLTVKVSWLERGSENRTLTFAALRSE